LLLATPGAPFNQKHYLPKGFDFGLDVISELF